MAIQKEMRILGGRNLPPYWERFDRLQRTAHKLLNRPLSPRGVFRFTSHEAFDEWKMNQAQHRHDHPNESTS
jgi:hypothetical protein